ncbi:hypothetical protein EG329_005943 [Mollisiaceae sp. DMI_Dod_QoI]|nr:hypothetical protein EG329_005943 [Helotiales sp. DMI_Dod_QoI]
MGSLCLPTIYYGFICNPQLRYFYWIFISAIACACITGTLDQRFSAPSYRPYRAALYASLGLAGFVFIAHGILIHGIAIQKQRMSLDWMVWMGTFNIIGAIVYAARVPERWYPYRFDFVGASHQIFHVMVVGAGLVHFMGLVEAFKLVREKEDFCQGWES